MKKLAFLAALFVGIVGVGAAWFSFRSTVNFASALEAEWRGLRGNTIARSILGNSTSLPQNADAAVYLPTSLLNNVLRAQSGTSYVPDEEWARKLGVSIVLRSAVASTEEGIVKTKIAIDASSSSLGITVSGDLDGFLAFRENFQKNDQSYARFGFNILSLAPAMKWGFLNWTARGFLAELLAEKVMDKFADRLKFDFPTSQLFSVPLGHSDSFVVDQKSKDKSNTDFVASIDVEFFPGAAPLRFDGALAFTPPVITQSGIWLLGTTTKISEPESHFAEPTPQTADAYRLAIANLKRALSNWKDELGGTAHVVVYFEPERPFARAIDAIASQTGGLVASAKLHDATGAVWKTEFDVGLLGKGHVRILARETISAKGSVKAELTAPVLDASSPSLLIDWPATAEAEAYAEISVDPVIGGGLPKIPVTANGTTNLSVNGRFGFEVAKSPIGNVFLFSPDVQCKLLRLELRTGSFDPVLKIEGANLGRIQSEVVGFEFDVIVNRRGFKKSVLWDGIPRQISPSISEKIPELLLPYDTLSIAMQPMEVRRTSFEAGPNGIAVMADAVLYRDHSVETSRRSDLETWLDTQNSDRAKSRVCPEPGSWKADIGGLEIGPNSDLLKILSKGAETGKIVLNDLVVNRIKDAVDANPTAFIPTIAEIRVLAHLAEKNLGPNNDLRKGIEKVDSAISSAGEAAASAARAAAEAAANAARSVGREVRCRIRRPFRGC